MALCREVGMRASGKSLKAIQADKRRRAVLRACSQTVTKKAIDFVKEIRHRDERC
jgi:hypothetical protein